MIYLTLCSRASSTTAVWTSELRDYKDTKFSGETAFQESVSLRTPTHKTNFNWRHLLLKKTCSFVNTCSKNCAIHSCEESCWRLLRLWKRNASLARIDIPAEVLITQNENSNPLKSPAVRDGIRYKRGNLLYHSTIYDTKEKGSPVEHVDKSWLFSHVT